ncbi:cyclin binding protein [Pseudozyma hubeiensis SY62]|uniref:Cyclin binding protein n=1 Tax=Pseudozyma hubeiensis (strain SY62) TaxID=1305764 RepID=R9PD17_PSEHS|nr:cyclin binding protein [Pseudozyma hubeiensis SY62]GAC95975.1 cyclin binding protein [Pseudozyma hubeiensis SY62]
MELSVDVHSTDVFLFPSKKQRHQSSSEHGETSMSSASSTSTLRPFPSTSSSTTCIAPSYDGESPAYSEVEDLTAFSSTKLSNDDQAILYAYVDIKFPSSTSYSSSSSFGIRNRLKSLTLTLQGNESVSFPRGGFEQSRTFYNEKTIDEALEIEFFEPGKTYRFERSFFVDHNSAPFQRSSWCVNNQKLIAKATFHGLLSKSLTATKKVYFVDCQNDDGNEMIIWDKDIRTHADGIGPFSLRNRSEVFTVGGYLRTNFDLLSPLEGVTIVGFRASVEMRTTLASRRERPGYTETVPPKKVSFLTLDRRQLDELFATKKLQGGGEGVAPDGECYPSLEVISRLPDDNKIRPSTVEGNDAAIRFRNFIQYEIDFIDGEFRDPNSADDSEELIYVDDQKMKRFHVSVPVFINSCGCRPDSLNLPTYACEDPMPAECIREKRQELEATLHDKQTDPSAFPCICTFTIDSLLEVEKKTQAIDGCSDSPVAMEEDYLPRYKSLE